ncbi:MAG: BrnT family toxin [Gemmatimonadetes bacterium]|nr:BrnT family toxin [Gemmatimonadota bacterium]
MAFEWDPKKAKANLKKHGVSFEEASTAFWDDHALVIDDPDHSLHEQRFVLLGLSSNVRLVTVVHCFRGADDVIRIISARRATPGEQSSYQSQVRR